MLWTICMMLLVLWALGLLTGYSMGGVLIALLIFATIVVLIQALQEWKRASFRRHAAEHSLKETEESKHRWKQ